MRIFAAAAALCLLLIPSATQPTEAPTGFDNKSNGMVDDATHQADQAKFGSPAADRDSQRIAGPDAHILVRKRSNYLEQLI